MEAIQAQKQGELRTFRGTALYQGLSEALKSRRLQLSKKLLQLSLASADGAVRGTAEAIITEATFDRELRQLESPDTVIVENENQPLNDKVYRDFNDILGMSVERELEPR